MTGIVMTDSDILDMFDHLCWYLCDASERFVPPKSREEFETIPNGDEK